MNNLYHVSVLIETYWNVKEPGRRCCPVQIHVLIETYWNVKFLDLVRERQDPGVVLIETYWNVKTIPTLQSQFLRGINRNILECKVWIYDWWRFSYKSINRNILECKGNSRKRGRHSRHCINRNILECKDHCCRLPSQTMRKVLIETYWNVKIYLSVPRRVLLHVLIETYWNVKISWPLLPPQNPFVLIETYWNVKVLILQHFSNIRNKY